MKIALLLFFSGGMFAQTLQILGSDSNGKSGSFSIILQAPPGKEPLALQWNVSLPPGVQVNPQEISAGDAARNAVKLVACALLTQKKQDNAVFTCLVAGGQKPISSGPLAMVKYKLKGHPPNSTVRIDMASAVSSEMKKIPMPPVQGTFEK